MSMRFQIPDGVPDCPGVYRFLDAAGAILYVGKAKSLKRRLGQYQKAHRRRRHRKMLSILKEAVKLEWESCATELQALLREAELIRQIRPRKNIAGNYTFLYPFVGISGAAGPDFRLVYTTTPDALTDYRWFGAFRSRVLTKAAYLGLRELLTKVAYPEKISNKERALYPKYTIVTGFRRADIALRNELELFLKGSENAFLSALFQALLQRPGARKSAERIQESLDALKRFDKREVRPLARAIAATGWKQYPVLQADRDPIFLMARFPEEIRMSANVPEQIDQVESTP